MGAPGEKAVSSQVSTMLDKTPVRDWVKQSDDAQDPEKLGRLVRVTVPTAAIEQVKTLIRAAGAELSRGIRFGSALSVKDRDGFSTLPFQTKVKKDIDMSPEAVKARSAKRAENKAAKAAKGK